MPSYTDILLKTLTEMLMGKLERSARNASKFQDTDWEEVDRLIKLDWSP